MHSPPPSLVVGSGDGVAGLVGGVGGVGPTLDWAGYCNMIENFIPKESYFNLALHLHWKKIGKHDQ